MLKHLIGIYSESYMVLQAFSNRECKNCVNFLNIILFLGIK